ncbi:MAG: S9 family peptidase [Oceanicaulis sp.]
MTSLTLRAALASGAAFAAAFAAIAPAHAQEPLSIDDLFKLQSVGSAAFSPDGDQVAYTVRSPRDIVSGAENAGADTHLWVYDETSGARPFITGEMSVGDVAWRPGTETITFTARRGDDETTALYEISAAGGEATRLYAFEESISDYVWGPDGDTLYFMANEPDADEADEDRWEDLGFNAYAYEEDLTFTRLWRVDVDGDADATSFDIDGDVSAAVISEDGSRLAVALAPTPLVDDFYMDRRWSVIEARSGDIVSTVMTEGKTGAAAFSPDGSRLAVIMGTDENDPTAGTLAVADVASGDYTVIAEDAEQKIEDMVWLDDRTILVLAHVSTESALVSYSVDGTEQNRRAQQDIVLRSIARSGAGRFAFVADSAQHPGELFLAASADGQIERATNHNEWLADRRLGEQRPYSFIASDGVRVDGMLITPQGRAPEGGWPLIMTVHGGPEAHDSDGWLTSYSDPGHVGAGAGYAVFYPNYRGSTGRGQAFARRHQNDYAGREFNDVREAVEALVADGIADADRVGITGGSYGGYAAMWGATAQSETFAASVAFVGVSNQISKFNTTDIPNEAYLVHSRAWPWEDWTNLLERSPVYYAGESETPTLILHGEEDTRVHPSQSLELYRSLKLRSEAPVRLIYYPGEGHGNRRAAAQFDYAHRMMRWFDHYLMGEGGEPPAADMDFDALLGETGGDAD